MIFVIFKMAAAAILSFQKFEILTVGTVKGHILHQRTKFHKDRSNRYGDIAIFVIFKMVAAAILNFLKMTAVRHLGFVKFEFFNGRRG